QATQTTESARVAMSAAKTLLDTEHVIVLGGTRVPIPRRTLANAITFENRGSDVKLQLARPPLANFLHRVFGAAEKEPKNARFAVAGDGSVNIVAEQD